MIIKCLFLYLFLTFPIICMSQNIEDGYLKDVDEKPLNKFLDDKTSVEYMTLDGRKVIAHIAHGVEFNFGKDSLNSYVEKHYYNQEDYDYIELNQRIIFSILFDKDLNIVEVRQLPHKFLHKEDCYKKLFVDVLKSTKGMWRKTVEGKEWYVYLYVTHLF